MSRIESILQSLIWRILFLKLKMVTIVRAKDISMRLMEVMSFTYLSAVCSSVPSGRVETGVTDILQKAIEMMSPAAARRNSVCIL